MSIQPIIVDEEAGESYQGLRMTADEYLALPETLNSYELIDGVIVQQFWGEPVNAGGYDPDRPIYHGVRMSADEYLALGETFERYELIDGVVIMSPSPTPAHQAVAMQISTQIYSFLKDHPVGLVFYEIDVRVYKRSHGREGVYRPDVTFVSFPKAGQIGDCVDVLPDLVVEVVSPDTRARDALTKKQDYEAAGIAEYWLVDPRRNLLTFYRLRNDVYVEVNSQNERFASEAIPGFALDIAEVRAKFTSL